MERIFEVRVEYPMDMFPEWDDRIIAIVTHEPHWTGGAVPDGNRVLGWDLETLQQAITLRHRIESTGEFKAVIREK